MKHGAYNDTLMFFTSDNGCHCIESAKMWPEVRCGGVGVGRSSGGLRGCKASNVSPPSTSSSGPLYAVCLGC